MRHQSTFDFAEICRQHEVLHAVVCPGSRSAPLVLAFANHPGIKTWVIPDERSAGFIALGMAQALHAPVVLICTSGTAALEFAPAVAEAFYLQVPLLVCTADRPAEWVDQRDGQTIRQDNLYGPHVKEYFLIPTEDTREAAWSANRQMNESILVSRTFPYGPVHLNFPFREPLYPAPKEPITFGKPRIIREVPAVIGAEQPEIRRLLKDLSGFKKILLAGGPSEKAASVRIPSSAPLPVLAEIVANLHHLPQAAGHADLIFATLSEKEREEMRPDLLITWGNGIISRNTRQFLRNHPAKETWHIQEAGTVADSFQHLTRILRTSPLNFLAMAGKVRFTKSQHQYFSRWRELQKKFRSQTWKILNTGKSEASLVASIISQLPDNCTLHLANSMSVRYGMMAGLKPSQRNISVFSNRGTSGIDGCSSTATGHALVNRGMHILITGDVAFFYDRNAFWHNYKMPNLRVCLLNNGGGQIFGLIDGPKERPEKDDYFIGKQTLTAGALSKEFGFRHTLLKPEDQNQGEIIKEFLKPGKQTHILEFQSNPETDKEFLKLLNQQLKQSHGD